MESLLFWFFAIVAVAGSIMVIAQRRAIYSALSLIIVLCSFAGFFFLLGASFVAAMQVIVYAGAIMILFVFIIWLLGLRTGEEPAIKMKWFYLAIVFCLLIGAQLFYIFVTNFKEVVLERSTDIKEISKVLLGKYVIPFELTSILFLAALVGAFYLAKGKGKAEK
ncbi:MAG: hypothetical protein A2Y62_05090 [Candidatus Fischerbacteria bacterium RBG_13_37_8]|uniref:NADH-quinone oxidoreductase subunit J n=1 Tax=Candidatus Fischerbacteria bacterium RBG_13_37_8 TaxID=1817863 RepID=A0A1F5V8N7_9BACT|nr:MAG: hypothetical protein A2Y62_05090 [Candidatus Fischerbacteria bacterium RBG_13_37_8]